MFNVNIQKSLNNYTVKTCIPMVQTVPQHFIILILSHIYLAITPNIDKFIFSAFQCKSRFTLHPKHSACVCVCVHVCLVDFWGPHGLQPARLLCPWDFSRQKHWSGSPCPSPGDLLDPGIKLESPPALQADSLPLSQRGTSKMHTINWT